MNNITTILFDMYGVILEESKGNFIPYTFTHFNNSEHERLIRQFKEEQLFTKAGNGEISSDKFLSLLGYENPQYHMKDYIENYLTLDSGFISFAETYYEKYDFVLLSNDVSEWSSYITEYYQLNKFFKNKIVSGDVKCRKPEKRIYELTLEKIERRPAECVFIDNSVKNLEVASKLGMQTILFNRDNEDYAGTIINSFSELANWIMKGLYIMKKLGLLGTIFTMTGDFLRLTIFSKILSERYCAAVFQKDTIKEILEQINSFMK